MKNDGTKRYCCLGLAAMRQANKIEERGELGCCYFDNTTFALTTRLAQVFGLFSEWGEIYHDANPHCRTHYVGKYQSLSQANDNSPSLEHPKIKIGDRPATFLEIADFIEKFPECIFADD